MKKHILIALLFLASWANAQQVEPVRYEVNRWNKEQGCHYQVLDETNAVFEMQAQDETLTLEEDVVVAETDATAGVDDAEAAPVAGEGDVSGQEAGEACPAEETPAADDAAEAENPAVPEEEPEAEPAACGETAEAVKPEASGEPESCESPETPAE